MGNGPLGQLYDKSSQGCRLAGLRRWQEHRERDRSGRLYLPATGRRQGVEDRLENNAYFQIGHLRLSPSGEQPPEDRGLVRPVSAERPPGVADPLPPASLRFKGCNAITLVLGAKTAYLPDRSKGWRGPHPHAALTRQVDAVAARPYFDLLAEHERDYQPLFGALRLDLGATPAEVLSLATDKRLARYGSSRPMS